MRNPDYQFVSTDAQELETLMISAYERITGTTVNPASPERLFIAWVSSIILQERVLNNYTGNQNIPSRAEGQNLDALGELFYATQRPQAKPASCVERFRISAAQSTSILIPAGTRVTDSSRTVYWETVEDVYVSIGATYADVEIRCQTPGTVGNDFAAGQISTIVDLFPFYTSCENLSATDGGSDEATDEEFYELMRQSMDAYSTAGSVGSYIYHAKSVSNEIADVAAIRPRRTVNKTISYSVLNGDITYLFGDDRYDLDTLVVHPNGSSYVCIPDVEYTVTVSNGVIIINSISIPSTNFKIDIEIEQDTLGEIELYALMDDGQPAGTTIKNAILSACSADTVRPLTDHVTVCDPAAETYNIDFTYYIPSGSATSSAQIEAAVAEAVEKYKIWQSGKLGRDINPDKLREFLVYTGIKRIVLSEPSYTVLTSNPPQYAACGTVTVTNGGIEEE